MAYTKAQLMALWVNAGGPSSVANVAASIALAESGGNADSRNSIGATGLWQIYNGPSTSLTLKDPVTNAKAAVAKYRAAGGFTPWTTYTGADTGPGGTRGPKTYLNFLNVGSTKAPAAKATPSGGVDSTGNGAAAAAAGVDTSKGGGTNFFPDAGIFAPLFNGLVKALVWVGLILGGAALVIVGAGRIANPQAA